MNIKWHTSGNEFFPTESSQEVDKLGKGIYSLRVTPMGQMYLARTQEEFTFGYKLYDIETSFIKRVHKTWKSTEGNIGILLNGLKGTGKTVTAELICRAIGLPVIIVDRPFGGLSTFLENVQQDAVIFFDEFEKVYGNNVNIESDDLDGVANGGGILSLMDGTSSKEFRRLFLLTTNKPRVNANMLERPSRLRYIKEFGDLSLKAILEIVDDLLKNKEFKTEVVKFVAQLNIITVDIVKAVINEVNIHNELPEEFEEIFNVTRKKPKFDIYWLDRKDGKDIDVPLEFYVSVEPSFIMDETFQGDCVGMNLYVDGRNHGAIKSVNGTEVKIESAERKDNKTVMVDRTYKLEPKADYHSNFREYAF